jgi:hypothetical protein
MSKHPHAIHVDEFGPEGGRTARDKRLFAVVLCVVIGALVIVGGILVAAFTHIPVQWSPLLYATGVVILCYAAFLWVRLTR